MPPDTKQTDRCPSCGEKVDYEEKACPKCGAKLPTIGKKKGKGGKKATGSNRTICPTCGASISARWKRCPKCKAEIPREAPKPDASPVEGEISEAKPEPVEEGRTPPEEAVESIAETPVAEPQPESETVLPGAAEKKPARRMRTRKLKSVESPAIPMETLLKTTGRTSGVGQVNGLGKATGKGIVNGTGAVNGTAFTNGTGISNGLKKRPLKGGTTKRASKPLRWQVLAVLLAIIIIIPLFVFLSYSSGRGKYSIDGNYADWDGATTYGTMIPSTSPTSNITEWAVGVQSIDLFLYIRTQTSMMSSPDAESFYLFVDSDGSSATGYVMESIGADYMLQITGWDSTVRSTSLSKYSAASDQYDWSAWTSTGSVSTSLDGARLEASAGLSDALGQSAKFVLVSKDPSERGSVSCTAPLKGGVLVVRQAPYGDLASTGIVPKSTSVAMVTLSLTCEGAGGEVSQISPVLDGATLAAQESAFSLKKGQEKEVTISVDTSAATDGQLISAEVLASSIDSTFSSVQIVGSAVSAYVTSAPSDITIDGAFADWTGHLSVDSDSIPVSDPGVDIDEVGNSSTAISSYFYVSVDGDICSGTFVPAKVAKPSGTGGGTVVPARHTAEDTLNIYIDSDRSSSTGEVVSLDSKLIGADQKIEVKGLFGKITSMKEFEYSTSGAWVDINGQVNAAKDDKRIEISVTAASLGGSADVDFIVETTSWEGRMDLATYDPASTKAMTEYWVVDPATASDSATSLSSQRKVFFDGVNYWSFYFDGANTVYKYSSDYGATWSSPVRAFATSGVGKVSVWYDPGKDIVYAVGDTSASTRTVMIQRGIVDPAGQKIAWNPTDQALNVSLNNQNDKNTFISKDVSGHLWILATNNTNAIPIRQDLSAFRSISVDNITSWSQTGNLIGAGNNVPTGKGCILPAGKGTDVWAIYTYGGNVASRKYTTSWSPENTIYAISGNNPGNTENAPPSAVVDSKGVVHVVYGTGRKSGSSSAPTIEYSHNLTGDTAFAAGLDLDPTITSRVGDYYPTISLDSSTDNLYVLWLRSDDTLTPMTMMGRICVSGMWTDMTFQQQTTYPKQYLNSAYSVPSKYHVCWQWTQNTTAPIQVMFDGPVIPEFGAITPLVLVSVMIFAVCSVISRRREETTR